MSYRELDSIRACINHDKLRNSFLNKFGNARRDLDISERSSFILAYWDNLLDRGFEHEDIKAKVETVKSALLNWPEIKKNLEDFFYFAPKRYGFKETDRLEQAKNKMFHDQDSFVSKIDSFIKEFDQLGHLDHEERISKLRNFWNAADAIYDLLHRMRAGIDEDAEFGEYFQKL